MPIGLKAEFDVDWDPQQHRLRCTGHIVNLAARAFLFQSTDDTLSKENNASLLAPPTENKMQE